MTNFINKNIIRTSINTFFKGWLFIILAIILFYGFTFWYKPVGIYWVGVVIFDLFFLLMFLAGISELFYAVKCVINPKKHDIFKTFAKYGNMEQIQNELEREITVGKKLFPNTFFTENYLIKNSLCSLEVVKFSRITRVYEKKVTTYLNFVLPIDTDYSIMIHANSKHEIEIPFRKKNVRPFLEFMISKNLDIKIGYSEKSGN